MKKLQAKVVYTEAKEGFKEVTAYKFEHELMCGEPHEFLAVKGNQGYWSVYEYTTGLRVCGGNKTRKGIVEHLPAVIERHALTKEVMATLTGKREALNA